MQLDKNDDKSCVKKQSCTDGETACDDGSTCILNEWICDGHSDCTDSSDEKNCTKSCSDGDFKCGDGKCILGVWKCDKIDDCQDGSDEANCTQHVTCAEGLFSCGQGQCIPFSWRCDSNHDCSNGLDETNCTTRVCETDSNQFRCGDGHCVPKQWTCDGEADCSDGSDEAECSSRECKENEFRCTNHVCIDKSLVCDRHRDCSDDGKDETDCDYQRIPCAEGQFTCSSDYHCIYQSDICDGHIDCFDGEDESNCTKSECKDHETFCPSNTTQCIPSVWLCDGENDCGDWSDESSPQCEQSREDLLPTTTGRPCKDGSYPCGSGDCVPYELVCNHVRDCLDGSDEGVQCTSACKVKNGNCEQKCLETPSGPVCSCDHGYEVNPSNNRTCDDVNECNVDGICSHYCNNTLGSFKCTCSSGYVLAGDMRRCKAADRLSHSEPQIIYMLPDRIRSFGLNTHSEHLMAAIDAPDMKGMDYDFKTATIFWVESRKGVINSKSIKDGTVATIRKDLIKPEHLVFDWKARNFYFFTSGYISACSFNGSHCINVLATGLNHINSLVLVPDHGIMFFSIWSDSPLSFGVIERAEMNGVKRQRIVSKDPKVQWPNGLVADPISKKLYWADTYLGQVGVSDFNGLNRKSLLKYSLSHPYGLAIFEDNLYIANIGTDTMIKCNKFTGRSRLIIHRGNVKSEVVRVLHKVLQLQGQFLGHFFGTSRTSLEFYFFRIFS